jgi:hypothetical protein
MRKSKASPARILAILFLLVATTLLESTLAMTVTKQEDDPITIVGTWATGSGQVETGLVSVENEP